MIKKRRRTPKQIKGQLELNFDRPLEDDRNHQYGGKSFYFFDFDDNVAYLTTPIIAFHKDNGEEVKLSSGEFAKEHLNISKTGKYKDYFLDIESENGSFKNFRDKDFSWIERLSGKKQAFLEDLDEALKKPEYQWKAPSWNCFYHAAYNQRPTSVITARGHNRETVKEGISLLVKSGHLPKDPNYLSVYPVSNPYIRKELGDHKFSSSISELKKSAIRESVEKAISEYGYNPFHRFGMSDDDPKNVELITEEMRSLKRKYPEMSFFVIQTFEDSFTKNEILSNETRSVISQSESQLDQLNLFI